MTNDSSALDLLGARYYTYLLLQSIFGTEPSENQRSVLLGETAVDALHAACNGTEYQLAVDDLIAYVSSCDDVGGWKDAYNRLFIGPGKPKAAPWESVYVNKEPLLFVESTIEVRRAYLDQGLAPKLFPHVADDHLSLELDFMKRLSSGAYESLEAGANESLIDCLGASKAFLEEHLCRWTGKFAQAVQAADDGLYARAAQVLARLVAYDVATIDSLVLGK